MGEWQFDNDIENRLGVRALARNLKPVHPPCRFAAFMEAFFYIKNHEPS